MTKLDTFIEQSTQAAGVKQAILLELHSDYWQVEHHLRAAESPQEKRAYAVLLGLLNSTLAEYEQ